MNIEHFLTDLKIYLRPLSEQQINIVLTYYQDYFNKKTNEGMPELEVVASVGSPHFLAEQILAKYNIRTEQKNYSQSINGWEEIDSFNESFATLADQPTPAPRKASFFQRFLQISGVLIINLFFMFWIFLGMALIIFSGWLVSLAFIASPFVLMIAGVTGYLVQPILSLSVTLLLFGLGIIGFLLCRFLTKYFFTFCRYYSGINYQVLRG